MPKPVFPSRIRRRSAERPQLESQESLGSNKSTTNADFARQSSQDRLLSPPSTTMSSSFSSSNSSIPPFVIKATAVASLGGILFGYDMGVISVAMPQLVQHFSLSDRQQEAVVGILYLGGGVGAAAGGSMCDRFGRWTSIVITDILFLIGAAVLIYAPSLNVLYAGRVIVGFAISVSGISDVAYLHELSPVQYRGAIVSVNEACISLGFLLAYIAGFLLSEVYPNHGWRVMFGLSGALAALQLIGMMCMPESPVWLHEQGYTEQAQQALRVIYGGQGDETRIPVLEDHVEHKPTAPKTSRIPPSPTGLDSLNSMEGRGSSRDELLAASGSVPTYESLDSKEQQRLRSLRVSAASSSWVGCQSLLLTLYSVWTVVYRYRKQVYIALFLSVAQQLSGQTVVLNYAPLIFSKFQDKASLTSTLYIGIVKFVMTVLVIWKIERLGRRFLLLSGMSLMVLGLLLITFAFAAGIGLDENGDAVADGSKGMPLALPGILFVVMGYSASFGPLTWLLTSELFPTDIRGRALGTSTIVTYLCASLVTSTFLSAQALIGPEGVFGIYALVTLVGIVFVYLAIPDTGGKNVTEIEESLMRMWWWRGASRIFRDTDEDRPVLVETELT